MFRLAEVDSKRRRIAAYLGEGVTGHGLPVPTAWHIPASGRLLILTLGDDDTAAVDRWARYLGWPAPMFDTLMQDRVLGVARRHYLSSPDPEWLAAHNMVRAKVGCTLLFGAPGPVTPESLRAGDLVLADPAQAASGNAWVTVAARPGPCSRCFRTFSPCVEVTFADGPAPRMGHYSPGEQVTARRPLAGGR